MKNEDFQITTMNRRKGDKPIGMNMTDPFFDSYESEGLCLYDMLNLLDNCKNDSVSLVINKSFLRKIVHTYLIHIKELERDMSPKVYVH